MPDIKGKNMFLIAEKPDLMRKIQACYDRHREKIPYTLTFAAQSGHLVTLKHPDELDESLKDWTWESLPINPEDYGGWAYKVIEEEKTGPYMTPRERYDLIKKEVLSGRYDAVINAGDPDQEGGLLVRLVLAHCGNRLPVYRFWTNDLTENHILDALLNLRDDENDPQLVHLLDAAYGRQRADYLFGMNLSRAATLKMGARVACGRVKTPILSIVCKREDEIAHFVPQTVYGVKARYEEGFDGVLLGKGEELDESVEEDEEEEKVPVRWFRTKEEAEEVASSLKRTLEITSYDTKRQTSYAPKLFKLATAQVEAGKMGYSAADTLRIIQGLYEKKLLSYPRTGCEYLGGDEDFTEMLSAAGCVPELRKYVDAVTDKDITRVKKTKTWVNAEELQKEGHSALAPTTTHPDWPDLDKEEQDIYRMVCAQFVAPFMPPLVQDRTNLTAQVDGHEFRSTGKTMVSPGWTLVFGRTHTDTLIPAHKKGDTLLAAEYQTTEKTTKCPHRYTTADLIAVCENPIKHLDNKAYKKLGKKLKIGTPATRAGIIEELIRRDHYLEVKKEGRREVVTPTKTGQEIIRNIHDCKICKVDITGEWELKLEKVRGGDMTLEEIDSYMLDSVTAQIEEFRSKPMHRIDSAGNYQRLGECPLCGKMLMRGPKMYYCTGYKEGCGVGGPVEKNGAVLSVEEFLDILSGSEVTKKMTKNGKTWDQKIACDKETGRIIYPGEYSVSSFTCPCCGKHVLESATLYTCEGRKDKSCGVFMPKLFGGISIPQAQFRNLFTKGKTDVLDGFKSDKTGKTYAAYFEADRETKKIIPHYSDPEVPTDYACPVCGRPIVRKGFRYLCSDTDGCGFSMPATMSKADLPDKIVKRLISAVKTEKVSEKASAYTGKVSTAYRCPCCGGPVAKDGMWFVCEDEGCGFRVYRLMSGHVLTDKEAEELFNAKRTGTITDFISKKTGKGFSAALVVNADAKKADFEFAEIKRGSAYKCPLCRKQMDDEGIKLTCGCGLSVWKKASGRTLTEHELQDLITKGSTGYLKMKKKDGTPFEAKLVINREEKKVNYEFKPRPRKTQK